jgi:hypothetical protein
MSRRTLLDLLGTEHLSAETERKFVEFCVWNQAYPALQQVLQATGLDSQVPEGASASTLDALVDCARKAANLAKQADLPVLHLGAVQGIYSEIDQMAAAAGADVVDADAVSFHAARLVGWATWSSNQFQPGVFKVTAEEVAYGEQLQALMDLLGAKRP